MLSPRCFTILLISPVMCHHCESCNLLCVCLSFHSTRMRVGAARCPIKGRHRNEACLQKRGQHHRPEDAGHDCEQAACTTSEDARQVPEIGDQQFFEKIGHMGNGSGRLHARTHTHTHTHIHIYKYTHTFEISILTVQTLCHHTHTHTHMHSPFSLYHNTCTHTHNGA